MTSPNAPRDPQQPNPWGQQNPQQPTPGAPQQPTGPVGQPSAPQPQGQPSANPYPPQGPNPHGQPSANPYPARPTQPGPYGQPGRPPQGQPGPYGQPGQSPRPQQGPYTGQPQQGPYAGQPQQPRPGQGYAQQPFAGGAAPAPGQNTPKSKLPLIIGGAVVGLVVLALLLSQLLGGGKKKDVDPVTPPTAGGTATAGSTASTEGSTAPAGDMSTPEGAVKAFMDALVAGDAEALLDTLQEPPRDDTFITDEVLKASAAKKALTDVEVTPPAEKYGPVMVSYKVNGKQSKDKLTVYKGSGDDYRVSLHLSGTGLYQAKPVEVGMKLNGVAVTDTTAYLLPGVYDVTTDNPWYAYDAKTITVTSWSSGTSNPIKPALSADADAKIKTATKAQLAACMKQIKTLETPECGVVYGSTALDGTKMDPNFLQCKVAGGEPTIDRMKLTTSGSDPLQLTGDIQVKLTCTARSLKTKALADDQTDIRGVDIDLNGKTPKITFSRY